MIFSVISDHGFKAEKNVLEQLVYCKKSLTNMMSKFLILYVLSSLLDVNTVIIFLSNYICNYQHSQGVEHEFYRIQKCMQDISDG